VGGLTRAARENAVEELIHASGIFALDWPMRAGETMAQRHRAGRRPAAGKFGHAGSALNTSKTRAM
jgi:hypothetical protein